MSDTTWTREKLIRTAQAHDSRARRIRENGNEVHPYLNYSASRKLAFDARRWARNKPTKQED